MATTYEGFSEELQSAIHELIPSKDPLDAPDFDVVRYVNAMFPTEASLSKLDVAVRKLKVLSVKADQEILDQVRCQSLASAQGKRELELAKGSIGELFRQIQEIKVKAAQSEQMVQDICADIKSLDYAKRHLTLSITTLKRLSMLITAVDQLKDMSSQRQYREVGDLLQAVSSLQECFTEFEHIERIAESRKSFEKIREVCRTQVYEEFEKHDDHSASTPAYFSDLCFVVEALGRDTRQEFVQWFVEDRLTDYALTFPLGEEISQMENLNIRFNWLRRELQFYTEHYEPVFPKTWEVAQGICDEFCVTTANELNRQLEEARNNNLLGVKLVVESLKATLAFEKELNARFSGSSSSTSAGVTLVAHETEDEDAERLAALNPYSPEALKLKWKRFQQEKLAEEQPQAPESAQCNRFSGAVSRTFANYLDLYVSFEEQELSNTMAKLAREDGLEDRNKVLQSSLIMFDQIREAMRTCLELSNKGAFLKVAGIFGKCLDTYGDLLAQRMKKSSLRSTEEEKEGCFIVNTAEYCANNTEELADRVRARIDPMLSDRIDLSPQQDRFQTILAHGMQALVRALEKKCEPAFTRLLKTNWANYESSGRESEYVRLISTAIQDTVPVYRQWLAPARFKFFCDSFATSFIPRFREKIFSCKQISESAAEQLLLDTAYLKSILDEVPVLGAANDRVPARFKRIVQKDFSKVERVLKVLMSSLDSMVDSYAMLVAKGGSQQEFQKLLELRGLKRADQAVYLEQFEKKKKKA